MSNYTKTVDFAAKDTLPSGDSGKIIKGTEFETEFDNISTAIATKADSAAPTFTGTSVFTNLDINGTVQADGAVTVGVDDTGYDVKFFGATAGKSLLWDESADTLIVTGDSTVSGTLGVTGEVEAATAHFGAGTGAGPSVADEVVVSGTSSTGLTIHSPDANNATLAFGSATDNDYAFVQGFYNSGSPFLRFSIQNSEKVKVTSTGIDVTGSVTADGLTVESGAGNIGIVTKSTDQFAFIGFEDSTSSASSVYVGADGNDFIARANSLTRFRAASNGDISFYNDAAAQGLFWDSSASALGIGTTTVNADLHLGAASPHIDIGPSTGNRGKIGYNTNNVYIGSTSGTGEIHFKNNIGSTDAPNASGDTKMVIADAGVGIGTDSPTQLLNLESATSPAILITDTTNTTSLLLRSQNNTSTVGTSSNHPLVFETNATEVMRLDAVGNAIFTKSGGAYLQLKDASAVRGAINVGTSDGLVFTTGSSFTEAMRIDSSQNLLVGKTAANSGTVGIEARSTGRLFATADGAYAAKFERLSSDGTLIQLTQDGASVGGIGTHLQDGQSNFFIALNNDSFDVGLGFGNAAGTGRAYYPTRDNGSGVSDVISIGTSTYKYKDLYLSGVATMGRLVVDDAAAGNTGITNCDVQVTVNSTAGLGIRRLSNGEAVRFVHNATDVGSIDFTTTTTSYNTSSDYRLKENVVGMSGATERLKQLKPSRFNFIADADTTVDGFLAHEVQDIVPEAITGTKDAMMDEEYEVTPAVLDDDGNVVTEAVMGTRSVPKYQGIDQSKLVPLLVATIQELEARIAALES